MVSRAVLWYFVRVMLLCAAAVACGYFVSIAHYLYAAVAGTVVVGLGYGVISGYFSLIEQLEEFAEAVKYRDFTRRYVVKGNHRSEEHTSELQSRENLVCRLL